MKKHKKLVGLLTAVLLVAALIAAYFGMDFLNPEERVVENSVTFFEVPLDDIVKVSVSSNKTGSYTMVKTEDVWTCEELPGQELDQSEIRYRVNLIDKIPSVRYVGDVGEDFSVYGLTEPQMTITVTLADGTCANLLIGKEAADDNEYAVIEGEKNVCTILPMIREVWEINPEILVVVNEEAAE